MPRNYKQIMDRLNKISQSMGMNGPVIILLERDDDGTEYLRGEPDRKPFDRSTIRTERAIIIHNIPRPRKE